MTEEEFKALSKGDLVSPAGTYEIFDVVNNDGRNVVVMRTKTIVFSDPRSATLLAKATKTNER